MKIKYVVLILSTLFVIFLISYVSFTVRQIYGA